MMIDVDWVYREFLRRGYRQEYASDFLDQAWKNSSIVVEPVQRTEPDHKPLAPRREAALVDLLNEIAEFLEGQSDVVDGSYGVPHANRAMYLAGELERYLPQEHSEGRPK